jgi:hypothetical protein
VNREPAATVWVHATLSVKPICTPGKPPSEPPYTLSWPGTDRCDSQNRSSPCHGKCGLATSMPFPCTDRSAPMAQPLLPTAAFPVRCCSSCATPSAATAGETDSGAVPGGVARAISGTSGLPLASNAMSRWYASRSTAVIGPIHGSPRHQPGTRAAPVTATKALNPATYPLRSSRSSVDSRASCARARSCSRSARYPKSVARLMSPGPGPNQRDRSPRTLMIWSARSQKRSSAYAYPCPKVALPSDVASTCGTP